MTAEAVDGERPSDGKPRRGSRRDLILSVALEMFVQKGYQATGIDEIGAAAGISGPAIYRHFASKQDLLAAAFAETLDTAREQVREGLGDAPTPQDRLERFVRATVHMVLDSRLLLALYTRELGHLPRAERKTVQRKHRQLLVDWARALCEVYPSLSEVDAQMAVLAVINLIGTLGATDGGVGRERLEELLFQMSLAALHAAGHSSAAETPA